MIYRTDIIKSDDIKQTIESWRSAFARQSEGEGFVNAKLHKVYKYINKSGYEFVSIACYRDQQAYDAARANGGGLPYLDGRGTAPGNLYTVVNRGHNPKATSAKGHLVVTNPYRIPRSEADRYAEMWDASKRHMENAHGFVNAYLFRSVSEEDEYLFVSRAEWRSEALFMKQFEGKDFQRIIAPLEGIFSICFSEEIEHAGAQVAQA